MIKFSITLLTALIATSVNAATVDLCIVETTDLYSNTMDFDYYKGTATERFGPVRMVGLVNDARNEMKDSVLVDNGDLIQGSPLADYILAEGLEAGDIHPAYKALSVLGYTISTLGNHESNYGPDCLKSVLAGAKFPYVNISVIDTGTKQPMFTPYSIKDTEVVDKDGKKQTLKIGYIGVVSPQIMDWGRANLLGKVTVNDITETVRKHVSEVREKGVDVVVVLAHSGLSADSYKVTTGNSAYYLSEIPDANATMSSHARVVFLGKDSAGIEGTDITKGMLNGVLAVMPGT